MSEKISLEGLDKAVVLAALYNASRPLGMGFMHYNPAPMTTEQARALLEGCTYFDYLQGRVMKVDLGGDVLDPWLYDRDNGQGAALRAIEAMKADDMTAIHEAHVIGTTESANKTREVLHQESEVLDGGIVLGLADVADILAPHIDAVTNL